VPNVDHAVLLVPAGSISTCGLVVVEVPPVNQAPVALNGGSDAAALAVATSRASDTAPVTPSTELEGTPANAPELFHCSWPLVPAAPPTAPIAARAVAWSAAVTTARPTLELIASHQAATACRTRSAVNARRVVAVPASASAWLIVEAVHSRASVSLLSLVCT
jgi:hypothetical protein